MKVLKYILGSLFLSALISSCHTGGIDPITPQEAGTDETAPEIIISSPSAGEQLIVPLGNDVPLKFIAEDDIELDNVSILIDGAEFENISEFKDYRRYAPVNGHNITLDAGQHTLQIVVTDKTAKKSTSEVIPFSVINMDPFEAKYGESFYMSFDGHFLDHASVDEADIYGNPEFTDGKVSMAYQGAEETYLSVPVANVFVGTNVSVSFWYNMVEGQDRASLLSASRPGSDVERSAGFRLFREGGLEAQVIKLNVGNGSYDQWFDGGSSATVNPYTSEWVHIAFTLGDQAALYINGELASAGSLDEPVSWSGCEDLYIANGGPYFSGWGHGVDFSAFDELRIFNKTLTQEEVRAIMDDEM